ncbi:AEC family transporter [Paucibacter sp. PLA-PC-4]|uniref:AEC family transporter n=1 Tax=Paucibacter sp. PLA-PC-4 TaxID=2993655 RepID=UPI00224940F7|nr:AEC family transporter [Paucibacter sp. PLA-PC-4]MCX2863130.1 AEC family transporter [Paucibacter sp. PLA-PC-4]
MPAVPAVPDFLLLLPDALLILCGFLLCRYTALNRPIWEATEKLVYYLLFPVLLFNSIVRTPLEPAQTLSLAGAGVAVVLAGVALAYGLRLCPGVDARAHASGAQVAFRFNSYIALALAERLQGAQGVAWVALLVALCVPICNVAAVYPLARHGGQGLLRELARNPLILSTVAGLIANLMGLKLPDTAALTLNRIGLAALPLGLMAVGAGLRFGALRDAPRLAAALLAIRHAALPLLALGLGHWLALPAGQRVVLLTFASLPTASSAYVLAARMGGHAAFVAGLVTLSTLVGMLSLPFWLSLL